MKKLILLFISCLFLISYGQKKTINTNPVISNCYMTNGEKCPDDKQKDKEKNIDATDSHSSLDLRILLIFNMKALLWL